MKHRASLFLASALTIALAPAAEAGHRDHPRHDDRHRHGHHDRAHHDHRRDDHHGDHRHREHGTHHHDGRLSGHAHAHAFVIPEVIPHHSAKRYEVYYKGRDWYGPHRHHHVVYAFPVAHGHRWAYEPRSYCQGRIYEPRRPSVEVRVRF